MNKKSDCKFVLIIGLSLILGFISQSCGSSRSVSYNEQVVAAIEEAINSFVFSFKATNAFPLQDSHKMCSKPLCESVTQLYRD